MRIRTRFDDSGAALIEAALVLPILLVLIFGAADLALFLWQQNSAQKAVQAGARKAIVSAPVADGPGLTSAESTTYWNGLPLGQRCAPERDRSSICPIFMVTCSIRERCTCPSFGRCNFLLIDARLEPIREAMRAILPQLRADQIEVSYATNYLGYVGRPVPVPVNVKVRIVDFRYDFLFLGNLLGSSLAISASAIMPSENMATDERGEI